MLAYDNAERTCQFLREAIPANAAKAKLGSIGYEEHNKVLATSPTEARHSAQKTVMPANKLTLGDAGDYHFDANVRLNDKLTQTRHPLTYNPGHYNDKLIIEANRLAEYYGEPSEQPRYVELDKERRDLLYYGEYYKAMHPEEFTDGEYYARRMFPVNYTQPPAPMRHPRDAAPRFSGVLASVAAKKAAEAAKPSTTQSPFPISVCGSGVAIGVVASKGQSVASKSA